MVYANPILNQGHRLEKSTSGHIGPVYACATAGIKEYVTAGKDGYVRLWDNQLQKLKQVGTSTPSFPPAVLTKAPTVIFTNIRNLGIAEGADLPLRL